MKLAIIGRGTAGALTLAHFWRWSNFEIDWYHDPNTKPVAVGEGGTIRVSTALYANTGFIYTDLDRIDGTAKLGIYKKGWNTGKTFLHAFLPPSIGYHINAVKLQDFIFDKFKNDPRINVIERAVTPDQVDADYVLNCTGSPRQFDDFHRSEFIPVNSCYVTQCFWDGPKFNHTLSVARPYGWIFGIPLKNRCSIGYLFNRDINSLDEIKEDVKEVFEEFGLTASDTTNYIEFDNYFRRQNFTDRVAHNGNSSFFLEPLEATSLDFADIVHRIAFDVIVGTVSPEQANAGYLNTIQEIEGMIMLHYLGGSVYKNKFWDFAQERAERCFQRELYRTPALRNFIERSRTLGTRQHLEIESLLKHNPYGSWSEHSFYQNLEGMELYPVIDRLMANKLP